MFNCIFGYADTGVADREPQCNMTAAFVNAAANRYRAGIGKLHRVASKIEQYIADDITRAFYPPVAHRLSLQTKLQIFFFEAYGHDIADFG